MHIHSGPLSCAYTFPGTSGFSYNDTSTPFYGGRDVEKRHLSSACSYSYTYCVAIDSANICLCFAQCRAYGGFVKRPLLLRVVHHRLARLLLHLSVVERHLRARVARHGCKMSAVRSTERAQLTCNSPDTPTLLKNAEINNSIIHIVLYQG